MLITNRIHHYLLLTCDVAFALNRFSLAGVEAEAASER